MSRICLVGAGDIVRLYAEPLPATAIPAAEGERNEIVRVVDPELAAAPLPGLADGTLHVRSS